jgi:hypothetical protein
MYKLSALLFLLFAFLASAVEIDRPMTAEDEIMMRELAWAEQAMEGYKRHHGTMPLRSSIKAVHVHTEEWKNDSIDSIRKSYSQDLAMAEQEPDADAEPAAGNLRKRNNALGGDR